MTTRQTKTPAQRAQEAVDVLDRRLKKLRDKGKDLGTQVQAISREMTEVEKRLACAKQNPDLLRSLGGADEAAVERDGDGA